MGATIAAYRPPFISQRKQDVPPYNDCAAESGFMLGALWTLGEIIRKPDGSMRDLYALSERTREAIGDTDGGLTLAQVDEILHELDPELPPLPRYPGQAPVPPAGATLRLDVTELRRLLMERHAAIVLGYQPGASVGHAILAFDGNDKGPVVYDPWLIKPLSWSGERWTWKRLFQFTSEKRDGKRYGSPEAIACAVVPIGDQTEAKRVERQMAAQADKLRQRLQSTKAQLDLVTEERDIARAEVEEWGSNYPAIEKALSERDAAIREAELLEGAVTRLQSDLTSCQQQQAPDCSAVEAERDGALQRAQQEQARADMQAARADALDIIADQEAAARRRVIETIGLMDNALAEASEAIARARLYAEDHAV